MKLEENKDLENLIVNYLEINENFSDIEIHNIIDDNANYLTIQISYTFNNNIKIEKSNFALYKQKSKFNRFKNLKDLLD
jgi:hypothetical protein